MSKTDAKLTVPIFHIDFDGEEEPQSLFRSMSKDTNFEIGLLMWPDKTASKKASFTVAALYRQGGLGSDPIRQELLQELQEKMWSFKPQLGEV